MQERSLSTKTYVGTPRARASRNSRLVTDLSVAGSTEPYRAPTTITKISAFSRTFLTLLVTVVWFASIGNEPCSAITARQPSPSMNWRSCERRWLRSYMVELTKTFGGRFFTGHSVQSHGTPSDTIGAAGGRLHAAASGIITPTPVRTQTVSC